MIEPEAEELTTSAFVAGEAFEELAVAILITSAVVAGEAVEELAAAALITSAEVAGDDGVAVGEAPIGL